MRPTRRAVQKRRGQEHRLDRWQIRDGPTATAAQMISPSATICLGRSGDHRRLYAAVCSTRHGSGPVLCLSPPQSTEAADLQSRIAAFASGRQPDFSTDATRVNEPVEIGIGQAERYADVARVSSEVFISLGGGGHPSPPPDDAGLIPPTRRVQGTGAWIGGR